MTKESAQKTKIHCDQFLKSGAGNYYQRQDSFKKLEIADKFLENLFLSILENDKKVMD